MSQYLCISIRKLDSEVEDCRDCDRLEWPPSPLVLFQAMVNAAATRWSDKHQTAYALPALKWLAKQPPPIIIAPLGGERGASQRAPLTNSKEGMVCKSGRGDPTPFTFHATKTILPVRFTNDDPIFYLWGLPGSVLTELREFFEVLSAIARSLAALKLGISMVAGNAVLISDNDAAKLSGEHWIPLADASTNGLRVPIEGTISDLTNEHSAFLDQLSDDGFKPVPLLSVFRVVGYRRATDPTQRPFAAFQLLTADAEGFWNRDARHAIEVAGMLRHATKLAAQAVHKSDPWINTFVLGHGSGQNGQAVGEEGDQRFSYIPLPTIRPQGLVGPVNRVLVVEPMSGTGSDAAWARRLLSGQELIEEQSQRAVALLSLAPASDWVVRQYLGDRLGSAAWSTVTPVVLPGYDDPDHLRDRLPDFRPPDAQRRSPRRPRGNRGIPGEATTPEAKRRLLERLDARTDALLRKAICQAGFPPVLADHAELFWRAVGFRPGLDLARNYATPHHLRGKPRYHVRILWRDANGRPVKVRGPVVIGAGRYCGLGLFAVEE